MQHISNTDDLINPPQSTHSIVEFFSRPARKEIAESLCKVILKKQQMDRGMGVTPNSKGRPPVSGITLLSNLMGVSRKSVWRWLGGEMQSSNDNAYRLLELASEYIPEKLEKVLNEDLERHRVEVEIYLRTMGVTPN